MTKTNKSYTKRMKVTRNGKLVTRAPGQNHFNAKQARSKQLAGKRSQSIELSNKDRGRFLPHS